MKIALILLFASAASFAQNLQEVVAQGEKVFAQTCATGYCHGAKGTAAGAPRLAARGFDQAYINTTTSRGLTGTQMPAFGQSLDRRDLTAVVAYVSTLNGIANPTIAAPGGPGGAPGPALPPLSAEAAAGRVLFSDALRDFGRCSICHEMEGIGIPVTTPITTVPADPKALRALAASHVRTAKFDGESTPALTVSEGKLATIYYDLTSAPPVLRTVAPSAVSFTSGSSWSHASTLGAYNDSELASILAYLKAVVKP